MRRSILFNDNWFFSKTQELPRTLPGGWEPVSLPHTWNAEDGQDGGNDYWRGTAVYAKTFPDPALQPDEEAWLEFQGVAMTAEVWLNGAMLTRHEGGYSTFRVDLTGHLRADNLLCVSVDNGENDRVYPQRADFTFYGGLYRDVRLLIVPARHFELGRCGAPGLRVTPVVAEDLRSAAVTVESWQNAGEVTFCLDGQSRRVRSENGYARAEFILPNVRLWDGVDDPYLYTATASLDSGDEISARFGCRRFAVDPQRGFLLNGRSYPLRGVSRHQDRKGLGNALTPEAQAEDMRILRELGANTVRLAHYQHAQAFYDLCDENGIAVWAEIPYITMHMPNGRANTLAQMEELIVQNYNHPSIICWGLSNEITAASAVNGELLENHRLLHELCHRLDPTRPTTMAHVFMLEPDSPILDIPDIGSYNLYFGWYLGELEQNEAFLDAYHTEHPRRAIGLSEYGADANPRYQSPSPERGDYTEGYQCLYHEHMLDMIEERPWLWATHVWNLFDFAADGRDEGGKHGENQKGLVTFDRSLRKDAFYLYKAAWNKKEPFVHLCGRRYAARAEEVTEVKAYSNQDAVSIYVDGRLLETRAGRTVFRFSVPLSGRHVVKAAARGCEDTITLQKAAEPDPDYVMIRQGPVINWLDQESHDPACYSVCDTLGEIRRDPEAGALVDRMMDEGAAGRGDVAQSVKDNPALQRMMSRMTLLSLLKQAGVEAESIKRLDGVLQKIRKP